VGFMSILSLYTTDVNLLFQGGYVEVKVNRPGGAPVGAARGLVNEFSPASRRRLMALIAKTEAEKSSFLTLTYPADFPSPREAKRHLKIFLQRLRRSVPKMSGIWRLEFQERGAPHFHLILFNFWLPKEVIQWHWAQVIGHDKPFTRIEFIRSRRKLMNYVSKYVAKLDGASEASYGFNLIAYLTADGQFIHPQTGELSGSIGRWWGIFNVGGIPFAPAVSDAVRGSMRAFYDFRRAARHRWSGVGGHSHRGFKLFVDDACQWFDLWLYCLIE